MTIQIQYSGDQTWQYKFVKEGVESNASITGDWKLAPMAAALGVGWDAANATGWWSNSAEDVTTRACLFDDIFRFGEDGSFANVMGSETWLEDGRCRQ